MSKTVEKFARIFPKLAVVMLIALVALNSCSKDDNNLLQTGGNNLQSDDFCQYVSEENFELTRQPINDFLKELNPNLSDSVKLEKLCDWLEAKDCVLKAEILHISGIYTMPAQSELLVTFLTQSDSEQLVMDILMSEPLVFVGYHEH
jgi:hypothetical protein